MVRYRLGSIGPPLLLNGKTDGSPSRKHGFTNDSAGGSSYRRHCFSFRCFAGVLLSVFFMRRHCIDKKTSHLLISALSFGIAFLTRSTSILAILPLFILMIY